MRIGIFDSGIGGLTVLKELLAIYPNNEYYYFGDNKNAPYGSKGKKQLNTLTKHIVKFLKEKDIDILIVACGTLSSTIINDIKEDANIPVYDVVKPTIDYLNNSGYDKVGVIATTMTIKSKAFDKANNIIIKKACPHFATMIENDEIDDKIIYDNLKSLIGKIDVLVLGCTHYPIISKKIEKVFDNQICLLNMGKILSDNLELPNKGKRKVRLYFSKVNHTLIENIDRIIEGEYSLEEVDLEEKYARITRSWNSKRNFKKTNIE